MGLVTRHVPKAGPAKMREAMRAMAGEFNRECMTGVKDPGIGSGLAYDPDAALQTWNAYRDVLAEGELTVRVFVLWISPKNVDDAREAGRADRALRHGGGGRRRRPPRLRRHQDLRRRQRRRAHGLAVAGLEPRRHGRRPGNRGYPAFDPEVMRELILLYHDAGLHIGDRTRSAIARSTGWSTPMPRR